MITLEWYYVLGGLVLAGVAVRIARDAAHPRRWSSAVFWALLAVVFSLGRAMPPALVGYGVVAMVALAATKRVRPANEKDSSRVERLVEAERLKNKIFRPVLLIPAVAVAGSLLLGRIHFGEVALVDAKQVALISLGVGAVLATIAAVRITGAPMRQPVIEGSRLLQAVGAVLILPQMLAALGGIFGRAGVGEVVAGIVAQVLPTRFPVVAVVAYCAGMAVFTICLGNAFAAFAVITGGIGLPLIVHLHHGNPAIMAAIGMLSGYCGTLMTPMAANFNLVPALLLELPDKNAVVKTQLPIGLAILTANALLMWACVYRF